MKPSFARHLAVLGTGSNVGKSLLTAAICRGLHAAGLRVAPYKAQNMSNNSYVAPDGGEIGRAQYLQALACGIEASVHHNPVLLKPAADDSSQIIVRGQAVDHLRAREYFARNAELRAIAHQSLDHLIAEHEVVVLEGAGSCAEVNLRSRDFVNFAAAAHAKARVILVADIDTGGVFAQVVGTLAVIDDADREQIAGIVINKFRGDRSLFDDGVEYLERRTGVPVLGVVPFLYGLDLDAEDALPMATRFDPPLHADLDQLRIAVIGLPHISNHTDLHALARVPGVAIHVLTRPRELGNYAAVIVPGSKAVVSDLHWLEQTGLAQRLLQYHAQKGRILGICGGFQMLGSSIIDTNALESTAPVTPGLGILRAVTSFVAPKLVRRTRAKLLRENEAFSGYEIHLGRTQVEAHEPLLELETAQGPVSDGVRDDELRVWGTYLHGLFDEAPLRNAFLRWVSPGWVAAGDEITRLQWLDRELDRFSQHVRSHLDWARIERWARGD
jgi:adenosylcobyric acid synthase